MAVRTETTPLSADSTPSTEGNGVGRTLIPLHGGVARSAGVVRFKPKTPPFGGAFSFTPFQSVSYVV